MLIALAIDPPGQRHLSDQGWVVRHVDGDRGAPDDLEGLERTTQLAQVRRTGAQVVVDEDRVGLAIFGDLSGDLSGVAHLVRHPQPLG